MNLVEVIVASALFVGACGGAAQIGNSGAQAMNQSRSRIDAMEAIEAQLLAVAPVLRGASQDGDGRNGPGGHCGTAAQWMQQQLEAELPPLPHGVERQLSLAEGGEQVALLLLGPEGLRRQRFYSPAAFGLCGGSAAQPAQETDDAVL